MITTGDRSSSIFNDVSFIKKKGGGGGGEI